MNSGSPATDVNPRLAAPGAVGGVVRPHAGVQAVGAPLSVGRSLGRMGAFLLVFALAAAGLQATLNYGMRRVKTSARGAMNAVMTGRVNAEILVSGSSRALSHYDPAILEERCDRTVFNLGRTASHIDMQVALLRAYLRHNAKPHLVVHNLDTHSFLMTQELFDPAQFMPFLDDPDLYRALGRIEPGVWKWKYLPLYGYAVEDMRLTWWTGLRGVFGFNPVEDHDRGYNPRDTTWTGDFAQFKAQHSRGFRAEIEPAGVRAMDELIELCAEQGIGVVLVYSPEFYEAQELTSNRAEIFARFRDLAARHQVAFWDFSNWAGCRQQEFFQNSQHLNRRGATAFSKDLGARLQQALHTGSFTSSGGDGLPRREGL